MSDAVLSLTLDCDCPLIESKLPSQRLVEVTVTAAPAPDAAERAPLNVALVIDRSGSMGGEKLPYVQEAACHVLDGLDGRDRVSVIAYDNEIQVLSPTALVTDELRRTLQTGIRALRPGGSTDLGGGWLRGAEEVAGAMTPESVNRVLLLTDGLANVGMTSREELTHHARQLTARGVHTSTFGVGVDYDHELLEAMANDGGGHYYFIEHPSQIPAMFGRELGEMLTVVAREAALTMEIPSGVAIELLNDLPHERQSERLRLFLRDLFGGERKLFYLKALTPPGPNGSALTLNAVLTYAVPGGPSQAVQASAAFRYGDGAQDAPRNRPLQERAAEIEMAAASARALKLEREGRRQEASFTMRRALAAAAPCLAVDAVALYSDQAAELEEGLTEQTRKTRHSAAYLKRNTRE